MKVGSPKIAYAVALVAGTALWTATSALAGKVEPWDSGAYWTIAYPIAIALSGVLGYLFPEHPWRWALVVIFTQLIVMILGGAGLGLLPLGMILLLFLSLPAIALASFTARVRRRSRGARPSSGP